MRRSILISGILFMLTAGVWGGVSLAAFACCAEETDVATGEHDCCRANVAAARRPASRTTSRDASQETLSASPRPIRTSHTRANRSGAGAFVERDGAAIERDGSSCGECCGAGAPGRVSATMTFASAGRNKAKRAAWNVSGETGRGLFSHASPPPNSQHAAKPHAPPSVNERLHVLHSLFLI
ncbi:MAG TPA: hypothetical protein VF656_00885 [Pyrinomonadaceae bacterium]|jgi:hypothetical protein